jgi:CBS domain-containing membrane protein
MTHSVTSVRPETRIADVVLQMSDVGLHHLPVVGADERLVGIISQTDLIAALLADAQAPARVQGAPPPERSGTVPAVPAFGGA